MDAISIKTVADFRRALALPGIVVILERNDVLGDKLRRSPELMQGMSRPRAIHAVRSSDFVFAMPDGSKSYMGMPKAPSLSACGTNVVDILVEGRDGAPQRVIRYRLEMPGSSGAAIPSGLAQAHPPLDDAALAREASEREAGAMARLALEAGRNAEHARIAALPLPAADTRIDALDAATAAAIGAALDAGISYDDDMAANVMAATEGAEFAAFARLPDLEVEECGDGKSQHQVAEAAISIAHEPRGTWRIVAHARQADRHVHRETMMSTGRASRARVIDPASEGTAGEAYLRMHRREIYEARIAVEKARKDSADQDALRRRGFRQGQSFKGLRLNFQTYSTATVSSVDEGACAVTLSLRKRGSPKEYRATLGAAALDKLAPGNRASASR